MYREFINRCRSERTPVKIHTANRGCVEGVIEQSGPEAIVVACEGGAAVPDPEAQHRQRGSCERRAQEVRAA